MRRVTLYIDYKSPFAYLAKDPAYELEKAHRIDLVWRHFTLDIASFMDSVETRSSRNWRRVRYAYMDARRLANARGLTVLGPQKIFDSSIAGIAMYFAMDHGGDVFRGYHDRVFERFWKRALDIEDPGAIAAVLAEAGADAPAFADYLEGAGRQRHDTVMAEAEAAGVFGVPTFVFDDELFWGTDRMAILAQRLRTG